MISVDRFLLRDRSSASGNLIVRLEDIQSLEFLVQNSERLELLGLNHPLFEPIFNLILLLLLYLFVCIVQVSVQL